MEDVIMGLTDEQGLEFAKLYGALQKINFQIQKLEDKKKAASTVIHTKYNFTAMQAELKVVYDSYTTQIRTLVDGRDVVKAAISTQLGV